MARLSLANYWSIPRVNAVLPSPDGRRLVLSVQTLAPDSKRFVTSLWEVPADGSAPPRRLTFSDKGEGAHAFLPDGSLVFASARPDVTLKDDDADGRLFLLPPGTGEAQPVLSVPGAVAAIAAARDAAAVVIKAPVFPSAPDLEQDGAKAKARKDAGVSGMLFEDFPIRYWDHDLGPRQARLLGLSLEGDGRPVPADLTPDSENALHEAEFDVTPDGHTVVTVWWRHAGRTEIHQDLMVIDPSGRRRLAGGDADYGSPAISPDGRLVAATRETRGSPEEPFEVTLWVFDLENGQGRDVLPGFDRVPSAPRWAPDGRSLWFAADEGGRAPLFNVDLQSGAVRRVAAGGAYQGCRPAPDGSALFAIRSSFAEAPAVVRIDARTGAETVLPAPGQPLELPGRVEEVTAEVAGAEVRGWLVLPPTASAEAPAPLLLWIHGGPFTSWNAWSWRWCPHLMAERGYAVLLPDPALSTGYGREFVRRGWARWGEPVWRDLEAVLDKALERPDLDAGRTAAMGGSFGGYMANWVAGHTDRFRAIVTHASIWDLEMFQATTDSPHWWSYEFGDPDRDVERYRALSPRSSADSIRTPMLIVHGSLDYRVPISEGLRLYTDLQRRGVPARYLYFPDENHWVLKPGNARLWYETVLAFVDEHVLGAGWQPPELL